MKFSSVLLILMVSCAADDAEDATHPEHETASVVTPTVTPMPAPSATEEPSPTQAPILEATECREIEPVPMAVLLAAWGQ
jgi:hypothetical protein